MPRHSAPTPSCPTMRPNSRPAAEAEKKRQEQEEEVPKSRLTQVWWLENGIQAVHYHFKKALGELKAEMADIYAGRENAPICATVSGQRVGRHDSDPQEHDHVAGINGGAEGGGNDGTVHGSGRELL